MRKPKKLLGKKINYARGVRLTKKLGLESTAPLRLKRIRRNSGGSKAPRHSFWNSSLPTRQYRN
jgi:hypothetical protein